MKRILLKLSGEALAGDKHHGFDEPTVTVVAKQVKQLVDAGVQVGIVIGGGNFWRGRTSETIDRTKADQIGMLATVMNCIYVSEIFRSVGMMTSVLTPFECGSITKLYSKDRANKYFAHNMVVFFAGGTGHPYFSTDTATVLRAVEIEADGIYLAKAIGKRFGRSEVFTVQERRLEASHLFFQPSGQDCQTHDLDQADVLLLDVVQLLVRMVKAHRMFRCGQVVAEYEVKLILAVPHPRDRRDRVVRLAVGFRKDHRVRVTVTAPLRQNLAREVTELVFVFRVQTQHRHRIFHDAAAHIFKSRHFKAELFLGLLHREGVVAALKMFVRQNAAADDGQVGIAAEEVVRELLHKRKQLVKGRTVDDHRRMLGVHDDGVFIIIDIRRILEAPRLAVHGHRHDAQILPRRVRDRPRIADVLHAKKTLRIPRRFFELRRRNIARVFFRLREIDRDFEFAVLRLRRPALVLCDAVAADIVAVLTELIEVVGSRFRTFLIQAPEFSHDFRRSRRKAAHEARVKKISLGDRVVDQPLFGGIIAQNVQTCREIAVLRLLFIALELQLRKERVSRERLVERVQQAAIFRVIQQQIERRIHSFQFHKIAS